MNNQLYKLSRIIPFLLTAAMITVIIHLMVSQPVYSQDIPEIASSGAENASDQAISEVVEAPPPDTETTPSDGTTETSLLQMYKTGGWAMYPLTILSILAFVLIIYNFISVRPNELLQFTVVAELDKALEALDVEKAETICKSTPGPITNIVCAGLARFDLKSYNHEEIKEAMEEASSEELSGPYLLINYLSLVASLSPMVGLLGTVSGMVKAFNVIKTEGAGSAQALAGNISEALITTATGMIVGIPAMFFFFYFKNKYGKIISRISRILGDLQFTIKKRVRETN